MTSSIFPTIVLLLWASFSWQDQQQSTRPPDQEGKPQINTQDPAGPPNTGSTGTMNNAGPPSTTSSTTGSSYNDTTSSTTGTTTTDTTGTSTISRLPRTDYEEPYVHRIRGELRGVDQEHHIVSIRSKDTTRPYKITKWTKFLPKGTSLATVHVGDRVSISYVFSHRRRIAVRIIVLGDQSK